MLTRFRKALDKRDEGFTLIELLVVMIIIGILAAIAIPVFLSQKNKAKDTSAKSDVNTISKNVQAYYVDGSGALTVAGPSGGQWSLTPTTTPVTTTPFASGNLSSGNVASGTVTSDSAWCVQVVSAGGGTYSVSAANGLKNNACTSSSN